MFLRAGVLLFITAGVAIGQDTVFWNSDAGAVNRMSNGQLMDAGFRFELGVFATTFSPSVANQADWAAHWTAARRTFYNASTKRYADSFTVSANAAPFAPGTSAWVWGFRGDAQAGEWILFRTSGWMWPSAASFPPGFQEWFARDATPLWGSIFPSGSPWLMQSAAVSGVAPPATTWAQWQAEQLAGEGLNGVDGDPDKDGVPNLLEFVFGTAPRQANPPVVMPVGLTEIAGASYAQITIPRRIDHRAVLTVEVSGDLAAWNSGPAFTTVVSDTVTSLVVRDSTPVSPGSPRRFLRLKASLP